MITLLIILAGSVLLFVIDRTNPVTQEAGRYLLSIGLFSLSGGLTNWIAIQMLFYKIPLVYGSGVLIRRYKAVRISMKDMILGTFFQPGFLSRYIPEKVCEAAAAGKIEEKINIFLETDMGQTIIDEKIEKIAQSTEGQLIQSAGIDVRKLKSLMKPILISYLSDLGPSIVNNLLDPTGHKLNLEKLRDELNRYMSERMVEVTPRMIQDIMYRVVLQYLGWVVLWGCVFGGVLGATFQAAGFAPSYENW